jgi:hypothetical protein
MAKDINFSAARLVYVSLMHVLNNAYKFGLHGTLKALRSPDVKPLIDEINPVKAASSMTGNRTTKKFDSGSGLPYWSVVTNFLPSYAATGRNTRAKTTGTDIQGGGNLTVDFNLRREYSLKWSMKDVPTEPDALQYMKDIVAGRVKLFGGTMGAKYGDMMSKLGLEILRTIDETVFKPINSTLLTSLMGGIGKNAAYPDKTSPSAAAPCVPVVVFDADGKVNENLLEAFRQTQLVNRLKGRLIVVGGRMLSRYMDKQGIMAINQAGVDLAKAFAMLPVLWYYDAEIDTIYGANKIIAFDSAAAATEFLPEHGPDGFVTNTEFANTSYGNVAVQIEQSAMDSSIAGAGGDTFEMNLDFTAEETTDDARYPVLNITPGVLYGIYKRPTSFFTTTSGNILKDVTGIFGFELTTPN